MQQGLGLGHSPITPTWVIIIAHHSPGPLVIGQNSTCLPLLCHHRQGEVEATSAEWCAHCPAWAPHWGAEFTKFVHKIRADLREEGGGRRLPIIMGVMQVWCRGRGRGRAGLVSEGA